MLASDALGIHIIMSSIRKTKFEIIYTQC